ncbi:MAG: deoxyhypusine synthase [Phycisphaerae bacterium]
MAKKRSSSGDHASPAGHNGQPHASGGRQRRQFMHGPQVEPLKLAGNEEVADLIDHCFGRSGFNGRRLAEACELYARMLRGPTTVGLTLSGAMTPIGMQGVLISLMEAGFVDWMICTGANLYHDLHRAFDLPVRQGHWVVDDNELADAGVARIYDTFIEERGTLEATDKLVQQAMAGVDTSAPLSSAALHWILGRWVARHAPAPQRSLLAMAHRYDVPIYTSSPGDSSIGMNLIVPRLFDQPLQLDPLADVIETAAIVKNAKKNGAVIVGGGSPKNFYLQTQPTLHQILYDTTGGGHDYFIQLTTDSPHWGGLSGATPSEARSWGKIKDATRDNVVVYSCASLTLPLLAQYVCVRSHRRPLKRLYGRLETLVAELRSAAQKNTTLHAELKRAQLNYSAAPAGVSKRRGKARTRAE